VAHLVSLGCAKNLVDSEIMLGALAQAGFAVSADPEGADLAVINTCGFVRDAVDESEDAIRALAALRREGRIGRLAVAGCLAQRKKHELREQFPEIDLLIGAAAEKIAGHLEGAAPLIPAGTLEAAVETAFARASAGDTVLLAPACASFDQFDSYEHRGRVFKELAAALNWEGR